MSQPGGIGVIGKDEFQRRRANGEYERLLREPHEALAARTGVTEPQVKAWALGRLDDKEAAQRIEQAVQ